MLKAISELIPIKEQIETVISITKYIGKIHKLTSYDSETNNPIHAQRWREAIEENVHNLKNHQLWIYDELPLDQKVIGLK